MLNPTRQENPFDELSTRYHEYNRPYFEGRLSYICEALATAARPSVVLDLGCGIGTLLSELEQRFPDAWLCGVDVSVQMIRNGVFHRVLVAEGEHLPFQHGTFDAIVVSDVLEHAAGLSRIISQCSICLRGGGILVVTMPNPPMVPLLNLSGRLGLSFAEEKKLDLDALRLLFEENRLSILDESVLNLYPAGPPPVKRFFFRLERILPRQLREQICFSRCFTLKKNGERAVRC